MRSDNEMYDLILGVAQGDERIRAVYMNGSRTNPNVQRDIFQDFDIVYVVAEIASFVHDEKWISVFGDLLMMQEPDKNDQAQGTDADFDRSYGFLMLFKDGNRIDLHIQTREAMMDEFGQDKLTIPLLDKDNCLPSIAPATDSDYHIKVPMEGEFIRCTNEFWWCVQNVAKGIWRDELPYAKWMFEGIVRSQLDEMVSWWIGTNYNFEVSAGKMGKYFKRYLTAQHWELYKKTYSDSNYDHFWDSIFAACELFRVLSKEVASHFSFSYPSDDDRNMTEYLQHVRTLPRDANGIY